MLHEDIKGWLIESDGPLTVALDTQLNEELIQEGLAREFVNRVQNMRKDSGFEVTDKIIIDFNGSSKLVNAVTAFKNYVSNETLAEELNTKDSVNGSAGQNWEIGEYSCSIKITRIK